MFSAESQIKGHVTQSELQMFKIIQLIKEDQCYVKKFGNKLKKSLLCFHGHGAWGTSTRATPSGFTRIGSLTWKDSLVRIAHCNHRLGNCNQRALFEHSPVFNPGNPGLVLEHITVGRKLLRVNVTVQFCVPILGSCLSMPYYFLSVFVLLLECTS